MKAAPHKTESKKRKRDDSQGPISESPKKAKVHAQRKFAQGAAFNSPVITPIKDKVRPSASASSPGPMLSSKRPNTEDFLTFLCFRRTSILPPKLDFFKDALRSEPEPTITPSKTNCKLNSEQPKQSSKKGEKNEESKKSQTHAVQALRRKYHEQRLAKQKVTNVTKLAQKVKGKNMVRTRSSTVVEDNTKPTVKKPIPGKENKTDSGLRSGLKRAQPAVKSAKKVVKPVHLRSGLRSSGPSSKMTEKANPATKTLTSVRKSDLKKFKVETQEVKLKNVKMKKPEGFSDFSSDDNEPLLAVKKPKMTPRKSVMKSATVDNSMTDKKTSVKTRSQVSEVEAAQGSIRPTRKTKEAAAIYMEMITKKLVSPEKSGDEDVSSVDSFPELPNAKRSEQRETEMRAKVLASKKLDVRFLAEEKIKETKKAGKKAEQTSKAELKAAKDETPKKGTQSVKKESKTNAKQEDLLTAKKTNKTAKEDKAKGKQEEKVDKTEAITPRSTRSRHQEELDLSPKKEETKTPVKVKKTKSAPRKQVEKLPNERVAQSTKKAKTGKDKPAGRDKPASKDKAEEDEGSSAKEISKQTTKQEQVKGGKKNADKGQKAKEEKRETTKETNPKKGKKAAEVKGEEKESEVRRGKIEKKAEEGESVEENVFSKRPTRKCSTADKIWIDIDGFTSDEDDFVDLATPVTKTRTSTDKCSADKISEKLKVKMETEKKSTKMDFDSKSKKFKEVEKESEVHKKEPKVVLKKGLKADKKDTKTSKAVEKKEARAADKKEVDKKELKEVERKDSKEEKSEMKVVNKKESRIPDKEKSAEKKDSSEEDKLEVADRNEPKIENKKESKDVDKKEGKMIDKKESKVLDKKEGKVMDKKNTCEIDKKAEAKNPKALTKIKVEESELRGKINKVEIEAIKDTSLEVKEKSEEFKKDEKIRQNLSKGAKSSAAEKKTKELREEKRAEWTDVERADQALASTVVKEAKMLQGSNEAFVQVTSRVEEQQKTNGKIENKRGKSEEEEEGGKATGEKTDGPSPESGKKVQKKMKTNKRKSDTPRSLREREASNKEKATEGSSRSNKRTRPVRQCSTGEKKWIETDSDSFSFYDTSDDEDNLPIVDFSSKNRVKSSPATAKDVPAEDQKEKNRDSDNFSESDEEPLKKKAYIVEDVTVKKVEIVGREETEVKSPGRVQRELPGLNPLKKNVAEHLPMGRITDIPSGYRPSLPDLSQPPSRLSIPVSREPKTVFYETKNFDGKSEVSEVRQSLTKDGEISDLRGKFVPEPRPTPVASVPNRIEMILHSLKRDKLPESNSYANDVKVTFGNVPYQSIPHSSQFPFPVRFPPTREPISTHGLDLLSEVALPTTPKEKINSQTERIEKWLKDSLAAEQKKTYPTYDEMEYKTSSKPVVEKSQPEASYYYGKPVPPPPKVSSHAEQQKFGQVELMESQKLLKRNVFSPEVKQDASKSEQQPLPPKKALTSVQDLLKLQKERKDVAKSSADNSPHLKNCKCNNCVVKKGWFKNKPVPKSDQQKSPTVDDSDESAKPFQSLTKAFNKISGEGRNSKMSVSVAPIVVTPQSTPRSVPPQPSSSREGCERKGIFQQRKLSFLERMKERERKEAAAAAMKPSPNAFSPNNESSVYAFEPEPEQPVAVSPPFRSKTRESRTSSTNTSKSDEDVLKICEDESSTTASSGTQVGKTTSETKVSSKGSQSASIAVQVNLDSETVTEVEAAPEDGKSIEISTQTEVPEEDSDSPMFYIPLQQARAAGASGSSDQGLIQGVALKLGTEGPMGPNQRLIMKAKLVTKPPDTPSIKAVVMPQPKRIFDQKNNNPPIGTVQPTTRKPPEALPEETDKPIETAPAPLPSNKTETSTEPVTQGDVGIGPESSKTNRNSPAGFSAKPGKNKAPQTGKDKTETSDDHSPCSSASSSKSKRASKQKSSETVMSPSNSTCLLPPGTSSKLVEAPTFHPTEKEFQDPFEFFDRIRPAAEKFGLCRIVPPSTFKPDCKVTDDMRFTAYNQYVHRLFHRWGPNIKEMMAIKKYLATQSISLKQPPWIGGIEVDLPRLYQSVQNCGGLMKVMEKKKWHQVADMMKIPKAAQDRVTKLDDIYCKYLLPYDTLSHDERQKLFEEVEKDWSERQRTPTESQESQGEEESEEENYIEECEECVVKGRNMALNQFYRIARNTMTMWFKSPGPPPREVENEFWKHVSERNHHVCVHSGSIDSSGWGYGFPVAKNNSFSKHPWNLKVMTNNSGSVLRSLGPVMGVTVPTIHVGMVFTAFCWYRDPHGLPWIEYLHTGAPKIWYGISDDNSTVFQEALAKLLPRYIKNKTIWLPSDTAMIPPDLLVEHGVSLCHTVQEPGQFILVFPRAFTSSICTGYLVSESVYFAQPSWLTTAEQVFKDIQESSEPTMFSLEKLLFSIATDSRSSVEVLKQVLPMVWHVRQKEIDGRKTLFNLGLKTSERLPSREIGSKKRKGRWAQEDDGDYECEICRMNLYVSLVTNSHEEGVYCLPHAVDLLTQKRHQLKYCKLMYTYTQEEMNEMVEKLEQRIESKSQKKLQGKSSTSTK